MPADRFLHPRLGHSDKVSQLTHLEYRVWTGYILTADDFGIMRATAVTLQAKNDALAKEPADVLEFALARLIALGLVSAFVHQGRRYVCQLDWNDFQKVTWPARTMNPPPPETVHDACTRPQQRLFSVFPGGRKVPAKRARSRSGKARSVNEIGEQKYSESTSEVLPSPRARVRAKRLTANGKRLAAHGGGPGEAQIAAWLVELRAAYPSRGVSGGEGAADALAGVFARHPLIPAATLFGQLREALAAHSCGEQWIAGMVPNMRRWLAEDLWQQVHPPSREALANARDALGPWVCPHTTLCGSPGICARNLEYFAARCPLDPAIVYTLDDVHVPRSWTARPPRREAAS